ncbi:Hypothetical protein LUCI_3642 [Lucifera butyrica]|uniref:Uncharacterized protein n=1 Tax=Lucifera butyrica TaxID=1351585 RepID=A0A498RBQ7_9FIRM|nr:DUF5320 domain-containing protein [Lucifera butyrica]VBB08370.1 Hypothetical protein LUCI_3642 [Lucifera butyrica]
MPRGDGTGPWGTRPFGRGRGGCPGFVRGFGFGRGMRGGIGRGFEFAGNPAVNPDVLEDQAARLEEQAAYLRNLAKQNRKAE